MQTKINEIRTNISGNETEEFRCGTDSDSVRDEDESNDIRETFL